MPALRVQGAEEIPLGHEVVEAGIAAHTAADIPGPPLPGLIGQVRIADQAPGQLHDVRLPGGDDLLHLLRFHQPAHRGHQGLLHLGPDRGGEFHVHPVGLEHAGMGPVKGADPYAAGANGDVDDVRVTVQLPGEFDPLLDAVAAGLDLGAADADLYREIPAALLMDGIDDLHGEAGPVFRAAAPAVPAGIEGRGKELLHQPAVGPVDRDHAEAAVLGIGRRVGIEADGLPDQVLVHLLHGMPMVLHAHAGPGRTVPVNGVGGIAPMLQLRGSNGPQGGDGAGQPGEHIGVGPALQVDVAAAPPPPRPVHAAFPDGDAGRAAQGLPGIVGGGAGRQDIVPGHVHIPGRGGKDPVAEQGVPQSDGFEKMGVLEFAHGRPFLSSFSGPINRRETRGKLSFIPGIRVDAGLTPPSPSRRPTR